MNLKIEEINVGDFVKVKKGIKAPDFEYQLMDNWQGKVTEIDKEELLISVVWNLETLINTPERYLIDLMEEGYDYENMALLLSDIELSEKRDDFNSLNDAKAKFEAKLFWISLYEDREKSITYGRLFSGFKWNDFFELFQIWVEYLSKEITFPFEAKVVETERGGMKIGTKIKVYDIDYYDEMYGILASGKLERGTTQTVLCNLEAVDKKSKNYELLRDYVIWFANR